MFKSYPYRHPGPELLDNPNIPFADIQQNMQELACINRWLGGHAITVRGLAAVLPNKLDRTLVVAELGSGGGDNLAAIARWAKQQNISIKLVGIDLNEHCVAYAQQRFPEVQFIHGSYQRITEWVQPDILFSALFAHHFTKLEMLEQLSWMKQTARVGFFINDLHRHPVARTSIAFLTRLFSKSYLVKHDAPLSVQRGWVRADWQELMQQSGIQHADIDWKWAFRWLVTVRQSQNQP